MLSLFFTLGSTDMGQQGLASGKKKLKRASH